MPATSYAKLTPSRIRSRSSCGTTLYDHTAINRLDDAWAGTRFENPVMARAMANLVADATPDFYLENIKRCVQTRHPAMFLAPTRPRSRTGGAADPQGLLHGADERFLQHRRGGACGVNPFDLMELVRRTPHGSTFAYQSTFRYTYPVSMMMIALGQHTRAGLEDNLWDVKKGVRATTIQMIRETSQHGQ